ncbi:hypothetical protein N9L68_03560 [bacterium]|nr:hypothetical protein [bacterium]
MVGENDDSEHKELRVETISGAETEERRVEPGARRKTPDCSHQQRRVAGNAPCAEAVGSEARRNRGSELRQGARGPLAVYGAGAGRPMCQQLRPGGRRVPIADPSANGNGGSEGPGCAGTSDTNPSVGAESSTPVEERAGRSGPTQREGLTWQSGVGSGDGPRATNRCPSVRWCKPRGILARVAPQTSCATFDGSAEKNRPVSKAIALPRDMLRQLQKEAEEDEDVRDRIVCWYETNEKDDTKPNGNTEEKVDIFTSNKEGMTAGSAQLATEVENIEKEIEKRQGLLDKATAIREKQLAEFDVEGKGLLELILGVKAVPEARAVAAQDVEDQMTQELADTDLRLAQAKEDLEDTQARFSADEKFLAMLSEETESINHNNSRVDGFNTNQFEAGKKDREKPNLATEIAERSSN